MQPTPQTGDALAEAVTPEAAFGMRLRQARERQGISLREMARRLTRSHSNLWDYERGHRLATVEVAAEYERELGLVAGELQEPLEEARRQVYGDDRDRRRPSARRLQARAGPVAAAGRRPDPAAVARSGRPAPPWSVRGSRPGDGGRPFLARRGRLRVNRGSSCCGARPESASPRCSAHLLARARDAGWLALCGFCLQGARLPYLPLASALAPLRTGGHASPPAPSPARRAVWRRRRAGGRAGVGLAGRPAPPEPGRGGRAGHSGSRR